MPLLCRTCTNPIEMVSSLAELVTQGEEATITRNIIQVISNASERV